MLYGSTPRRLVVGTGADLDHAVQAVAAGSDLSWTGKLRGPIAILGAGRAQDPSSSSARARDILRTVLSEMAPTATFWNVRPASPVVVLGLDRRAWTDVAIGEGATRFDRVRVLRDLAATVRCLVTALPDSGLRSDSRPLSVLAAYAHPRQRLAVRLVNQPALLADLALPLRPRLVLLVGTVDGRPLAVATADLIAAELVWLALRPNEAEDAGIGPWEDATVQRATELDLGVRLPSQIELAVAAGGDPTASAVLAAIVDRLRLRLGIP